MSRTVPVYKRKSRKSDMNMNMLGKSGETLVSNFLQREGWLVETSVDQYDNKQDMKASRDDVEVTVEVKTQQPWHYQNAFTVKYNQLQKCLDVDALIFVETPSKQNGYTVRMWNASKRDYFTSKTRDGRTMYCFDIADMDLMETYDDFKTVNNFKRFSNSEWSGQ